MRNVRAPPHWCRALHRPPLPTLSSNGYAIRSQAIAQALTVAGHSVTVATLPGLPWDCDGFNDPSFASHQRLHGIPVLHARSPSQLQLQPAAYRQACVAIYR